MNGKGKQYNSLSCLLHDLKCVVPKIGDIYIHDRIVLRTDSRTCVTAPLDIDAQFDCEFYQ